MSPDFRQRSSKTEFMDTEVVPLEDYRDCLRDLSAVNTLTLTHNPILAWLDRATRNTEPSRPITILDVGFGYGDLLRRICRWSRARGRPVDLVGVDLNPYSETIARSVTSPDDPIEYRTGNVFAFDPGRPIDFIVSSQTAHHLSNDELAAFIAWMERVAVQGWFVADLHRHTVPYHAFRVLSRLAGWHRFVQHDGPISIARSFRRVEWEDVLRKTHLHVSAVRIRWHVPFRLSMSRLK